MIRKNMRKNEIDELLSSKGDFVKIDYLTRFLKLFPPISMRKYSYLTLARIYLNRSSFTEAAKMFNNASINCLIFKEKQECHLKEAKSYIRAAKYDKSIQALKKAFIEASQKERFNLFTSLIEYYKKVGEELESKGLSGKATKLYEKLITMKISEEDKDSIREKLLSLYKKLGKTREYDALFIITE